MSSGFEPDDDYDASPHDAGFGSLRYGISFVAEYGSLALPETRLAWAIEDLKGDLHDLVEALMEDDERRIQRCTKDVLSIVRDMLGDI
jgi:hypothetical protein